MGLYRALKPVLFRLPAESIHSITTSFLTAIQETPVEGFLADTYSATDPRLEVEAFGVSFQNPVGVAAGFDKNAQIPRALACLGFGHIEIGGITADAQPGNDRPRLFRLPADRAIINRMGFNNHGADRIAERLVNTALPEIPIGVNIGKSKQTPLDEAPDDYAYTYDKVAAHGDYFVINVSSPNTPGLRSLQEKEPLADIISTLQSRGASPLLVKISPDLATPAVDETIDLIDEFELDGIIATNTTVARPDSLQDENKTETGGLSGKPLEARSTKLIKYIAKHSQQPIIGVGGVFTAEDAYEKIKAGASLVQLYTGLVYQGPGIARDINHGLGTYLDEDGFETITDAVGTAID